MRIGIDIGGSHVGIGLIDKDIIVDSIEKNLSRDDRHNIEDVIISSCIKFIKFLIDKNNLKIHDIDFIGIAAPGDVKNGIIVRSDNLGLYNFDIIGRLKNEFDIEMNVRNDAKCAGLAEFEYGNMKNYSNGVFIGIGTGIGGACFVDDKLLNNGNGFEIGHMIVNKGGRQCSCGKKGCFESYSSIKAFKNKVAEVLDIDSDFSGQYLRENLLDFKNPKVREVIDDFIDYLVVGIGNVIDIFEPDVICFGGSFSYYDNHPVYLEFLRRIREDGNVRANKLPDFYLAKYKNDAGIIGATLN